jgi:hypothetical protein
VARSQRQRNTTPAAKPATFEDWIATPPPWLERADVLVIEGGISASAVRAGIALLRAVAVGEVIIVPAAAGDEAVPA